MSTFQESLDAAAKSAADAARAAAYAAAGGAPTDSAVASLIPGPSSTQAAGDSRWQRVLDIASVKSYGAMGDGTTDDTTAIQTALNAGRSIWFPAGTYIVTAQLTIPSGVRLLGDGSATIKAATPFTNAGYMFVAATSASNVHISGLTLDSVDQVQGIVLFNSATDCLVTRCILKSTPAKPSGNMGVDFNNCQRVEVSNCEISGTLSGVGVRGGGDKIKILRNYIHTVGYINIRVWDDTVWASNIVIDGNHLVGDGQNGSLIHIGAPSGDAYMTGRYENVRVSNNVAIGQYTSFAVAGGNGDLLSLRGMKNAVVYGNYCAGGGDLGLVIEVSNEVTVGGNVVRDNEISGLVVHDSDRVTVTGNTCVNNCTDTGAQAAPDAVRAGIRIMYGSTNVMVSGNHCTDTRATGSKTQLYGVAVWNGGGGGTVSSIVVGKNHVLGNKWGGYYTDYLTQRIDSDYTLTSDTNLPMEHVPQNVMGWSNSIATGTTCLMVVDRSGVTVTDADALTGATSVTSAGAGTLTANKSVVGILLDDKTVHWSVVSAQAGSTLTLATALPSPAAAGSVLKFTRWRTAVNYL